MFLSFYIIMPNILMDGVNIIIIDHLFKCIKQGVKGDVQAGFHFLSPVLISLFFFFFFFF
ncbi:uncharacterized protein EV154DRAFT_516292, partial [Mucor mucedo]|uniref:uncharacterized protein n=1 Tax=Mucor mucedo TaxID=29922 RepID=UPI0022200C52